MTDAQLVGLVILAAMSAPCLWLIRPLCEYRRTCRELDEARREWDEHIATTPGLEPVERDFLRWEASL